ncbi:tyramine receptor 1 [Drosophila pseudoobscura]|uniref:Tyramine receptor 1 n=1 Tax=Drosophila pseudoobscura pseudoobscura TaxID=46245 RepID=A0A6I8WE97_DROPS|nr:tyramine receptor 1 [Drosophila pseudoobscura]XP_033241756.1 tyramine receptor 1 [Drosophila pseudoobscura]
MAVNLQLNNLSAIYPSLMYVAASSLGLGLGLGRQENISIVYEDLLGTASGYGSGNGTGTAVSLAAGGTGVAAGAGAAAGTGTGTVSGLNVVLPQNAANETSNEVGDGGLAVALTESAPIAAVTTFNYYNESAAAAEWAHFYDLVLSWQGICLIAVFATFIVVTVIGNTLVILAILTTRRLRTITNCFVMSLAVADLLVGIFVMPPAVAVHLTGSWQLGWVLCDIWISLDVLLCTASILSLCAISVDRYLAVTRPLTYSRKRRSKRLALIMILIVWLLALAITCPPILGWYEPGRRDLRECRYNQNEGYVIFSAMGSFFIPMAVMIYVYARISCVIASRHDNMTDISVHNKKFKRYTAADVENELSEQEPSSAGHRQRQATSRTFSNQTIAKELHEMMLGDSEQLGGAPAGAGGGGGGGGGGGSSAVTTAGGIHCQSLLALPSGGGASSGVKNGCYELTRPSSLKRTSTASTTITTMTSGVGPGSSLLDTQWQSQSQSQARAQSFRHSHLGLGSQERERDRLRGHHLHHLHHLHHQHHQSGVTTTSTGGSPNPNPSSSSTITNTNSKSLSNRITSLKKETKTTQTLSIVVGGFIACWLPFFINYLITPFLAEHQVSQMLAKALTWLGWFNSAINPFIYAFYSVDFRAAFWRLTCKRFFSSGQKPQFPTNTMSIRR